MYGTSCDTLAVTSKLVQNIFKLRLPEAAFVILMVWWELLFIVAVPIKQALLFSIIFVQSV
jgi:hypothetical protein